MNGGIQEGTSATSKTSKTTDNIIKDITSEMKEIPRFKNNPYLKSISKLEYPYIPYATSSVGYIMPDGGVWTYKKKIILVSEAKHQQCGGNALERLYYYVYQIANVPTHLKDDRFLFLTYITGQYDQPRSAHLSILAPLRCVTELKYIERYKANLIKKDLVFNNYDYTKEHPFILPASHTPNQEKKEEIKNFLIQHIDSIIEE